MPDSGKDSHSVPPCGEPLIPGNVARAIHQRLISLKTAGVMQLPKSLRKHEFPGLVVQHANPSASIVAETRMPVPGKLESVESARPSHTAETKSAENYRLSSSQKPTDSEGALFPPADSYGAPLPVEARTEALALLQTEVASCTTCQDLANSRTQTVFGVGAANPRLVFFGEAPGADEDRLGEPFVGAAGQLLTKIIEAMKLSRDDVYILNTLKCRPPGNRNPKEIELQNCCDYSIRQLEILQPEFICCLGSIAAKTLLNSKLSIGRLRGHFYKWRGSRVLATYHPAYLLRSPEAKKHVWNDMKILMAEMGL